jgi:hypothetical protein
MTRVIVATAFSSVNEESDGSATMQRPYESTSSRLEPARACL